MKINGVLKVVGKSLFKVAKVGAVGLGSAVIAYGPDVLDALAKTDPKYAAIAAVAYTLIDAWKHRDKLDK